MNKETEREASHRVDMQSTLSALDLKSGAAWLASGPVALQDEFLAMIGEGGLCALPFLFEFWAMDHQLPPDGDWRSWVILGGRGAGKTRAGAEWVRAQVEGGMPLAPGRARRVALVGETFDQVRDVMVFGDSGIMACSPPDRRPHWKAGEAKLIWPNGAEAKAYSAHDPDGLRGPQFDAAWVDELGCGAVDKGTNQPNKFLDPKSSESALPRYSNGQRDDYIQAQYLRAMFEYWNAPDNNPQADLYPGHMVDMANAYVWAWDTRPFPFFPNNLALWDDGLNYLRGHWINGRISSRTLASVVEEVCQRAGVISFDVSALQGVVRGYGLDQVAAGRSALQPLMLGYGFDAVERDGTLVFQMRSEAELVTIDPDLLAVSDEIPGQMVRMRETDAELAGRVRLRFVESEGDHEIQSEEAVPPDEATHAVSSSETALSLTRAEARQTVERWLVESRVARDTIRFALPPSRLDVGAGDVVALSGPGQDHLYRVDRVEQGVLQTLEAVRVEPSIYDPATFEDGLAATRTFVPPVPVQPLFLDLPLITGDEVPHAPHLAVTASPWPGSVAVLSSDRPEDFRPDRVMTQRAILGRTKNQLGRARPGIWDIGEALEVELLHGALESRPELSVLNGANLAAIGDGSPGNWELFQFQTAELVEQRTYWLTGRLRGQLGSDALMPDLWPEGSWVVLLNGVPEQIGLTAAQRRISRYYRIGPALRSVDDPSYVERIEAFDGNGLRPYAPVHLRGARDASGALDLTWIRRTRLDGDSWDVPEVPLGEEREAYLVRVFRNDMLLREVEVTAPAWRYDAAMQAQDGSVGEVRFDVAQISARYGQGLFARSTLML